MDPVAKEKQNGVTQQPVPMVGVGSKEGGVRASVEASESLPKVEQELAGIIKTSDQKVPNEPQLGITPSLESTPVATKPLGIVQLPMTEEETKDILKNAKHEISTSEHLGDKSGEYFTDSKFFLATLVKKLYDWKRLFGNAMKGLTRKPV